MAAQVAMAADVGPTGPTYGGAVYDSDSGPILPGSGGGCGWRGVDSYSCYGEGGRGGGAITFIVAGAMRVDGSVGASGLLGRSQLYSGYNYHGGGGAGGSLWLKVGMLGGPAGFMWKAGAAPARPLGRAPARAGAGAAGSQSPGKPAASPAV